MRACVNFDVTIRCLSLLYAELPITIFASVNAGTDSAGVASIPRVNPTTGELYSDTT